MDKKFDFTLYLTCNFSSMLELKLNHVSKRCAWWKRIRFLNKSSRGIYLTYAAVGIVCLLAFALDDNWWHKQGQTEVLDGYEYAVASAVLYHYQFITRNTNWVKMSFCFNLKSIYTINTKVYNRHSSFLNIFLHDNSSATGCFTWGPVIT